MREKNFFPWGPLSHPLHRYICAFVHICTTITLYSNAQQIIAAFHEPQVRKRISLLFILLWCLKGALYVHQQYLRTILTLGHLVKRILIQSAACTVSVEPVRPSPSLSAKNLQLTWFACRSGEATNAFWLLELLQCDSRCSRLTR